MFSKNANHFRKKVKEVKFQKISVRNSKKNHVDDTCHWKATVENLERASRKQARKKKIKNLDLSTTLPPILYRRISKILPMPPIEDDKFEEDFYLNDLEIESQNNEESYQVRTALQASLEKNKSKPLKLKIDPTPQIRREKPKTKNWFSDVVNCTKMERIKWQSKLYNLDADILDKPIFDQAEEAMDMAAQDFSDFVRSFGNDKSQSSISKNFIKQLFSLGLDNEAATAITVEPKIVNALPHEIASRWSLPQMSLKLKVQDYIKEKAAKRSINPRKIAFGRCLPVDLQEWALKSDDKNNSEPAFPEDLTTAKSLFKGIEHLKSTRALIDFFANDYSGKPEYLAKIGTSKSRKSNNQMSLFEKYKEKGRLY